MPLPSLQGANPSPMRFLLDFVATCTTLRQRGQVAPGIIDLSVHVRAKRKLCNPRRTTTLSRCLAGVWTGMD